MGCGLDLRTCLCLRVLVTFSDKQAHAFLARQPPQNAEISSPPGPGPLAIIYLTSSQLSNLQNGFPSGSSELLAENQERKTAVRSLADREGKGEKRAVN